MITKGQVSRARLMSIAFLDMFREEFGKDQPAITIIGCLLAALREAVGDATMGDALHAGIFALDLSNEKLDELHAFTMELRRKRDAGEPLPGEIVN